MREDIKAAVEAVLFVYGQAVALDELVEILEVPLLELRPIMRELLLEFNDNKRGLQIIETAEGYLLCTNPDYADILARLTKTIRKRFSPAALETLAIIAYRQPVTRIDIDRLRGVKSDKIINNLLEQGLIANVGNKPGLGKSVQYSTTAEFLRVFGLTSVDDLPPWQEED